MKIITQLICIGMLSGAIGIVHAANKFDKHFRLDESLIQPKVMSTANMLRSAPAPLQCPAEGTTATNSSPVTITSRIGPTGFIEILEYGIFASFYEDDQIITASNAPNCVAWVRGSNKPISPAGDPFGQGPDITASSSTYGFNPIQIEPDSTNFYLFGDSIFDATASATVQIETQGNVSVPRIPKLTLHSPGSGITKMITPVNIPIPDGVYEILVIDSDKDYEIAWEPINPAPAKEMSASIFQIVASSVFGSSKLSQINCVFPYAAGQGKIPSSLLTEVRTRTLNGQPAFTSVDAIPGIQVWPGEARFINLRDANYFVYISRSDSVNQLFPNGSSLQPPSEDCPKSPVKRFGCGLPVNGR